MNPLEVQIVALVILYPDLLAKVGDFEPVDFELRDLWRIVERWIDQHRESLDDDGSMCQAIFDAGHADLAAYVLMQEADESLLSDYLELWREG